MSEPIRLTVNRDDCPGIVAQEYNEIMERLGIKVTVIDDGEDSSCYEFSKLDETQSV